MFFYCTVYNSNFLFSIRCSAATTRRNSFLVFFFFKWRKHRPNADGIDTLVQWKLIDSYSMLNYWVGFERTVMLSEFHLWNRLNDTRTCRPRGREEQTRDWKSIQQVVTSFQSRGRCDGLRQQQGDRHSFIFSSHVNDFLSEWTPTLVLTTCHQRRRWGVRTAAAAFERKVNPPSSPPSSLSERIVWAADRKVSSNDQILYFPPTRQLSCVRVSLCSAPALNCPLACCYSLLLSPFVHWYYIRVLLVYRSCCIYPT